MKSHRRSRNSRQAVVLPLYSEEDENDKEEEHQTFPDAYHPDLSFTLLQRIKINEIISLDLQNRHNFKEDGCRILACALFLNTSIASLDLWGTNISAGASLLIHALAHLRPPNSEPCATHQLLLAHCFMFIKTFSGYSPGICTINGTMDVPFMVHFLSFPFAVIFCYSNPVALALERRAAAAAAAWRAKLSQLMFWQHL